MRPPAAIALAVAAGISAGILVLVLPDRAGGIAHGLLVVLLALALAIGLERLRRTVPPRPSQFDGAFAPPAASRARPASLARVEREVTLATGTAFDIHYRLRPVLEPIASGLLLRRGVELERGRELLGAETWDLVRPDRPAPRDRTAPGLPLAEVERVVSDLERLACS